MVIHHPEKIFEERIREGRSSFILYNLNYLICLPRVILMKKLKEIFIKNLVNTVHLPNKIKFIWTRDFLRPFVDYKFDQKDIGFKISYNRVYFFLEMKQKNILSY